MKFGHLQELPTRGRSLRTSSGPSWRKSSSWRSCRACFRFASENDILWNDPNLAEGLPVREAVYEVKNGEARLVADPAVRLPGGDCSDLKKWEWHDATAVVDARAVQMSDLKGGVYPAWSRACK